MYELHRKPQEMVADSSAIAVSPRALHSELMCPICLDLMRNTQTTKEVCMPSEVSDTHISSNSDTVPYLQQCLMCTLS